MKSTRFFQPPSALLAFDHAFMSCFLSADGLQTYFRVSSKTLNEPPLKPPLL